MNDRPNQKPSGRASKQVSEPVYPADILSDAAFRRSHVSVKGAWFAVLLEMWRTGSGEITGTPADFALEWNCNADEFATIIAEMQSRNIFDVHHGNADVTLVCRRIKRREIKRKQTARRVMKHRCNTADGDSVTPVYKLPSVSSSLSVSPTGKDILSDFDIVWKAYPSKTGKGRASKAYAAARKAGADKLDILNGVERYKTYVNAQRANGFADLKWQNGSTWFGNKAWQDEWTYEPGKRGAKQSDLINTWHDPNPDPTMKGAF
jgi:hypothetical protein